MDVIPTGHALLVCGAPGSGKTELGNHLEDHHGWCHLDMESPDWPSGELHDLWDEAWQSPSPESARRFLDTLMAWCSPAVLTYGFPPEVEGVVRALEGLRKEGLAVVWLNQGIDLAFARYQQAKGSDAVVRRAFDDQVKSIDAHRDEIFQRLRPEEVHVGPLSPCALARKILELGVVGA